MIHPSEQKHFKPFSSNQKTTKTWFPNKFNVRMSLSIESVPLMFWQFEWHYNKDRTEKIHMYCTYAQYNTSVCLLFLQLDEFYTPFFELLFVRHGTVLVRYIER